MSQNPDLLYVFTGIPGDQITTALKAALLEELRRRPLQEA
jgi:hypothetical protein